MKQEIGASWGEQCTGIYRGGRNRDPCDRSVCKDKFTDPSVIVLDEKGTFAHPALSGHVGGGVTLAKVLAEYTGGRAVITTATDVQKKFAADVFAMENGLVITDPGRGEKISAGILEKRIREFFRVSALGDIPKNWTICGSEKKNNWRMLWEDCDL